MSETKRKLVGRIISEAIYSKPSSLKQRISSISLNAQQYDDQVSPITNMTKGEEGRAWIAYGKELAGKELAGKELAGKEFAGKEFAGKELAKHLKT
jgi:hypothetical protein